MTLLEVKLRFITLNRDLLSNNDIIQLLDDQLQEAYQYVNTPKVLLYDRLKEIENKCSVDTPAPPKKNFVPQSHIHWFDLKTDLKKLVDWPLLLDHNNTPTDPLQILNGNLNKLRTGSDSIDSMLSNLGTDCGYDLLFSTCFGLLKYNSNDLQKLADKCFNGDISFLTSMKILSKKYSTLIPRLTEKFKATPVSQRFNAIDSMMREHGLSSSERFVIQKCYIESFLHGILLENYDVEKEFKAYEVFHNLHKSDGTKYILEWFQPLRL